ncbi:ABC transporter ATP-binding protein [Neoroseomonas rubea]|uniref:ABC transporter ATP-binding protein n=1 Tax=Neoroseomonas rubea TaxID=2748666 RepID=UPI0018DF35B6|nr:ABC transporter ATP-binding protein [Roseomonas rubea]
MALIDAAGLAIEFPLYHHNARSLKQRLISSSGLRLRKDDDNRIVVAALRDLTFRIGKGERVALVGPNGAGKTTLLRTVAGVYEPVAGRLLVEGEIGSLIDPAAGMDPLLTGRENVILRALYRGMTEAEGRALAEEVAGFAGLGDFLDMPIRGYSAGMNVRLAFAMATAMTPEILLMDEWFLAGDAEFMARAEERLAKLVTGAEILLIATHDMGVVRKWCTRAIKLEGGRIVADGPVAEVLGPVPPAPTPQPGLRSAMS